MTLARRRAAMRQVVPRVQQVVRNRPPGALRVWLLTGVLVAAAAATYLFGIRYLPAVGSSVQMPWWSLAFIFATAEVFVVHVQFRSEAHSVSLNEIPLVLGLFFVAPDRLLAAQLLGAGVALLVHRRQAPIKLAFNLSQLALGTGIAVVVFHHFPAAIDGIGMPAWAVSLLAATAASLAEVVTIACAISLSEGRMQVHKWVPVAAFAVCGTAVNTCLALLGVTILVRQPFAAVLLVAPTSALVLAYRAYTKERQEHERIEFLYRATRILDTAPETERSVMDLLSEMLKLFRAEIGQVILLPGKTGDKAARSTLRRGEVVEMMVPVDLDEFEIGLVPWVARDNGPLLVESSDDPLLGRYLKQRGIKDAMIAGLRSEQRVIGMIVVGNRLGDVTTFRRDDLRLLEMLAGQVGAALENGWLERTLKHQAFHDSLTALVNRAVFADRVEQALTRPAPSLAVLFVDVDDFKTVNDSLGHGAGDQLLVTVADRLRLCVRPVDTVARLGGDEFAILIEGITEHDDATQAAQRILDALRVPTVISDDEVRIHCSIGIATTLDGETEAEALLRNADVAMYSAKALGKRRHCLFEPSMREAVRERHSLKADLERAVERQELIAQYQPIVDLETGGVVGAEALVRWMHPERGFVGPATFISLAEETGLIKDIGRWILREACVQVKRWQNQQGPSQPLTVSVNLSAKQLQDRDFIEDVATVLETTGVEPRTVTLEVTESIVMDDVAASAAMLRELKELGVRIAMDDFGTGYSSLSYLRDLPVDVLKIDKSFVDGIPDSGETPPFLHAITRLGDALDLELVAEGIERPAQAEALRNLACRKGQGFAFAAAMSGDEMLQLLRLRPRFRAGRRQGPAIRLSDARAAVRVA